MKPFSQWRVATVIGVLAGVLLTLMLMVAGCSGTKEAPTPTFKRSTLLDSDDDYYEQKVYELEAKKLWRECVEESKERGPLSDWIKDCGWEPRRFDFD